MSTPKTKQERSSAQTSVRRQPVRTCVGCGQRRPAATLIRCAFDGQRIEPNRIAPGRGAWVCGPECCASPRARKGLERTLRRAVTPEQFHELADLLKAAATHN